MGLRSSDDTLNEWTPQQCADILTELRALRAERDRYREALASIGEMTHGGLQDQAPWEARKAICKHEKIVEHIGGWRDAKRGYFHCDYCKTPATEIEVEHTAAGKDEKP